MAPLETLEPKLQRSPREPTGGVPAHQGEEGASGAPTSASGEDAKPGRILNVLTHFMKGDSEQHLGLKVKLPPAYDDRTVREAIVEPFVAAYDERHPDYPLSALGPFTHVKVLVWAGPIPNAADRFREKDRDGIEDITQAEKPIYCLMDVQDPVSALRKRAHNKLKPKVELELVAAESTAIVVRGTPSTALLAPGEALLAMLNDLESEPEDLHAIVDAALAGGELAYLGLTTARDRHGKNCLHTAVTRGDLTLCRKLLQRREDVHAMDSNRSTAIHMAALAGRQLIVKDLLSMGALLHEKNRDLMNPLQLACVDEAQGNGEVVRMLVEAGADIDAKCWDVTPLMAACSGGHHWAIETLLELGADSMIRNGYEMMAMDYCRDQNTMQIVYDFMRGFFLPDAGFLKRQKESRERRQKNTQPGLDSGVGEDKGPRLFQASRVMPLPTAFEALNLPAEWVEPFKATGEHYADVRRKWRQVVLVHHPDRLPANLASEAAEEHAAAFTQAMSAFEAIDMFYAQHHAPETPEMGPDPGSAPPPGAGAPPPGDASDAKPATAPSTVTGGDKPKAQPTVSAKEATARAARPLLYKRRVQITGLQAKPEYNGQFGRCTAYDKKAGRYAVQLESESHTLKVKEGNLLPAPEVETAAGPKLVAID
jgi:hypothetical protein